MTVGTVACADDKTHNSDNESAVFSEETQQTNAEIYDLLMKTIEDCNEENIVVEECFHDVEYPPQELVHDWGIYMTDEGAIRRPLGTIDSISDALSPQKPIILFCIETPYGCLPPQACRPWIHGCPPDWCPDCGDINTPVHERGSIDDILKGLTDLDNQGYLTPDADPNTIPPHILPYVMGVIDGARLSGR